MKRNVTSRSKAIKLIHNVQDFNQLVTYNLEKKTSYSLIQKLKKVASYTQKRIIYIRMIAHMYICSSLFKIVPGKPQSTLNN